MRYTNRLNLPQAYVNVVERKDYESKSDVSVTGLTNPVRQFWLRKRHDEEIEVDVVDRLFALYGQAMHHILEKGAPDSVITEERLRTELCGWSVSGQPDLFTEDCLQDWKSTSAYSVQFDANKMDYVFQLNAYRYLASVNGFGEIKRLQNIYIMRDWSARKAKVDESYPNDPIEVVDQEVWSLDQTKGAMIARIEMLKETQDTPDHELPLCSKEERWHRGEKWALMKEGRKTAIKLCDTPDTANQLLSSKFKGATHIDHRVGEDIRCMNYCDCKEFCDYWRNNVKKA